MSNNGGEVNKEFEIDQLRIRRLARYQTKISYNGLTIPYYAKKQL